MSEAPPVAPAVTGPVHARGRRQRLAGLARQDRRVWTALPVLAVLVAMAVVPAWLDASGPGPCVLQQSLDPPSLAHPFGFDVQGCDLFARTVHGTRNSLLVGFGAVVAAGALAVVIGALAGFFGGFVDSVVGATVDLLTGIPVVLAGLVLLTVVEQRGLVQVILVLVVFAWPVLTSVMRTEVRRVSRREYVTAARSLGASPWAILRRHVVPNATGALGSVATLLTATLITTEAILTFVGAGLRMPNVSWGILLAEARERLASAPHLALPGVFLVVAAAALIMLADALREHRPPA